MRRRKGGEGGVLVSGATIRRGVWVPLAQVPDAEPWSTKGSADDGKDDEKEATALYRSNGAPRIPHNSPNPR